jgi:hypothetical protein
VHERAAAEECSLTSGAPPRRTLSHPGDEAAVARSDLPLWRSIALTHRTVHSSAIDGEEGAVADVKVMVPRARG